MHEVRLGLLLLLYCVVSFSYYSLCILVGRAHHPLGAYQVYALGCAVAFGFLCLAWRPRRLWPPTRAEGLAALSSILILTSATLSLLLPESLVAILAGKGGCLVLVGRRDRWRQTLLGLVPVLLASWDKPLRVLWVPLGLAGVYVAGYALKLRALDQARQEPQDLKHDFLAAEQLVVALGTLAVAGLMGHVARPAPLSDWRLWGISLASLGTGLVGTRLMLHATARDVTFTVYRMASLVCALAAKVAHGDQIHPTGWAAVLLACGVIGLTTHQDQIRAWWGRPRAAAAQEALGCVGGAARTG